MERKETCIELTDARKDETYQTAVVKMRGIKNAQMQQEAIELFRTISGWRDADEKIAVCEQRIRELNEKEETERHAAEMTAKTRKKTVVIALSVLAFCAAAAILLFTVILPANRYGQAKALYNAVRYEEAITAFEALNGYGDSEAMIQECRYGMAEDLMTSGKYEEAIAAFEAMDGYRDSAEKIEACEGAFREQRYAEAEALENAGKYDEAYSIWTSLKDFRDSADRAGAIYDDYKAARLRNAEVGEYVLFGAYEQDNDASNGPEDIEWLVLSRDSNGILVVSRYLLDCKQYNTSEEKVSWETCSLRKWLNETFYNSAFSAEEQQRIRDVIGKVFLLSTADANRYMDTDEARRCAPTAYAIAQGAMTSTTYQTDGTGTCGWWLRNPYSSNWNAATITIEGAVSTLDVDLWLVVYGVRPALWINTGQH